MELHRFYKPSHSLTDDVFLDHVRELQVTDPSLVHRVGRHYRVFQDVFFGLADRHGVETANRFNDVLANGTVKVPASGERNRKRGFQREITLAAVVRPDIDTATLARTFLRLAEREREGRTRKDVA